MHVKHRATRTDDCTFWRILSISSTGRDVKDMTGWQWVGVINTNSLTQALFISLFETREIKQGHSNLWEINV